MKRPLTLALLGMLSLRGTGASACGSGPTAIGWGEWRVSSSEMLWTGYTHSSYPLTHLFDDNPRTTWVFSGTGKCAREIKIDKARDRYSLELSPTHAVEVDELRIMNGYNRSRELFLRNNRIVQMSISDERSSRSIKVVTLKDSMGWHSISLPRRKYHSLRLAFTGIKRGRDNDICVSGIELYNRGRKIDMHMPEAVDFDAGFEDVGCEETLPKANGSHLLRVRDNTFLARNDWWETGMQWSPTGRFVCAGKEDAESRTLWVADTQRGRIVYQGKMPDVKKLDFTHVEWLGNGKLALVFARDYDNARKAYKHTTKKIIQFI